jgi:hypothetical protein
VHVVLNTKVFKRERLNNITFAPMRGIYLRLKIIYICTFKMSSFLHRTNMPTVLFLFLSLVLVTTFETRGDIFNHSVYV